MQLLGLMSSYAKMDLTGEELDYDPRAMVEDSDEDEVMMALSLSAALFDILLAG